MESLSTQPKEYDSVDMSETSTTAEESAISVADVLDDDDEDDLIEEALAKTIHVDREKDKGQPEGKVTKVPQKKARKSKH